MNVVTEHPRNAEPAWEDLLQPITPHFFQRNHFEFPAPHAELDLCGRTLSLEALRALPTVTAEVTLECAGNGRKFMEPVPKGTPWGWRAVSNAAWTGVPLHSLIDRERLPAGTVELLFQGGDDPDYARSLTLEDALRPEVLVVHTMNGQPLPQAHGGPVRLLVPGWYAMASIKWLTRIEALTEPFQGYYQVEDYQFTPPGGVSRPVGRMLPRALIVTPLQAARSERRVEVTGWAWSGFGRIEEVQLQVDGRPQSSELAPERGPYAWRAFRAELELEPGEHTVLALAGDSSGRRQPVVAPWNEAGYENNSAMPVTFRVS